MAYNIFMVSNRSIAALMVDIQLGTIAKMNPSDAESYLDYLSDALSDLRNRHVPVVFVTVSDRDQIYSPFESADGQALSRQTLDSLYFYHSGQNPVNGSINNFDLFNAFMSKHGPRKNEAVFCKTTFGAFEMPNIEGSLEHYLKHPERQINDLLVMGTTTQVCCLKTAIGAASKGFLTTLVSDGVVGWTHQEYDRKQGDHLLWGDDGNWHKTQIFDAINRPPTTNGHQLYDNQERSHFKSVHISAYSDLDWKPTRPTHTAAFTPPSYQR